MTDSNFTPEYNNEPVPGTEVTTTPGLHPETIQPDTPDGVTNVPYPTDDSANGSVTFTAPPADGTYTVPPTDYHPPGLDPRVDEVVSLLHDLSSQIEAVTNDVNQKIDHLLEHLHHQEVPVQYEGHVVLHPVAQPPAPDYNDGNV
tara:strand:- start:2219 stop:2653 length:435 start_codon:yes stop_codon:yes gene_type:complete